MNEVIGHSIITSISDSDRCRPGEIYEYGECVKIVKNFLSGETEYFFKPIEKKPPIGIMPKHIWQKQRIIDLGEAIKRYEAAGLKPKQEWVLEYNEGLARGYDL